MPELPPEPSRREHLVFFGLRPWTDLVRFGFFRTAGATFGCLLRDDRFAAVTYVHLDRRPGARVVAEAIGPTARALSLPAGLPLGRFSLLRRFNRRVQSLLLSRALGPAAGLDRLFWLNDWEQIRVAERLGPGRCLVDCQDDAASVLARMPSRLREVESNRGAATARADLVVAVDPVLLEGIRERGTRTAVAPNGVSTAFLESARRAHPEPEELAGRPRPRLVVVAGEWSFEKRVDHELLTSVLDRLEGWTLVLVGVPRSPGPPLARLVRHPRVVALGPRPYLDLVPLLRSCDVGAVPYREGGGRDVLKAWEYLACGLRVVSSRDEPRPDLAPWITVATGSEAFAAACASSLRPAAAGSDGLRAILEAGTWEKRTARLLELLDGAGPQVPR